MYGCWTLTSTHSQKLFGKFTATPVPARQSNPIQHLLLNIMEKKGEDIRGRNIFRLDPCYWRQENQTLKMFIREEDFYFQMAKIMIIFQYLDNDINYVSLVYLAKLFSWNLFVSESPLENYIRNSAVRRLIPNSRLGTAYHWRPQWVAPLPSFHLNQVWIYETHLS